MRVYASIIPYDQCPARNFFFSIGLRRRVRVRLTSPDLLKATRLFHDTCKLRLLPLTILFCFFGSFFLLLNCFFDVLIYNS